jgi:hypothetical protein
MLNLIRKDFIAGALFLLGAAILIPFLSSIAMAAMIDDFGGINMGIFTFIVIALCVGASFIFIAIDTSFKTEMTHASLPLRRSTIVLARYVSSIIITLTGFSLVILSCLTAAYLFDQKDPAFQIFLSSRGITSMISLMFIIVTIMLPFMFKFGPGKGIIVALIVQIGIVLFFPLSEFVINALKNIWNFDIAIFYKILEEILIRIESLPEIYAYLFVFSIVVAFNVISIILSIRFYNMRVL